MKGNSIHWLGMKRAQISKLATSKQLEIFNIYQSLGNVARAKLMTDCMTRHVNWNTPKNTMRVQWIAVEKIQN